MSKYRIVIDCDGPFLPFVSVRPSVEDDGSISGLVMEPVWDDSDGGYWDEREVGMVYEDSPGPLVVVADGTGGNPNGVPGSVSVTVSKLAFRPDDDFKEYPYDGDGEWVEARFEALPNSYVPCRCACGGVERRAVAGQCSWLACSSCGDVRGFGRNKEVKV